MKSFNEDYLKYNIWKIVVTALLSLSLSLFVVPLFVSRHDLLSFIQNVRAFLSSLSTLEQVGLGCLAVLLLIAFNYCIKDYLRRRYNNWSLKKVPFVAIDYLYWFVFFFVLGIIYKYQISLIALLVPLFLSAILFCTILPFKKNQKQYSRIGINDHPIERIEEDKLGREKFIELVTKELISLNFKESITYGIVGKWGDGKTSVKNLLKKAIKDSANRYTVIEINPWNYLDDKAFLLGFYGEIERAINKKYSIPYLSPIISKYVSRIIASSPGLSFELKSNSLKDLELFELKNRIQSAIYKTGITYYVFIDDLDRLPAKDIMSVFRIISCSADFNHVRFILFYDNEIVVNQLRNDGCLDDPKKYIEKIVQATLNLPLIEPRLLDDYLFNHLEEILSDRINDKTIIQDFFDAFNSYYRQIGHKFFYNLRDVKRYLISIKTSLPMFLGEISLYDYCLLKIIGTKEPKLFNDMTDNPEYYIDFTMIDTYAERYYTFGSEENQKRELINTHFNDLEISENIKATLCELFYKLRKNLRNGHSVVYHDQNKMQNNTALSAQRAEETEYFFKYLLHQTRHEDISDNEINKIIKTWKNTEEPLELENEIINELNKYLSIRQFYNFSRKLIENNNKLNSNLKKAIIKSLFKFAEQYENDENPLLSQMSVAVDLCISLIEIADHTIQNSLEFSIKRTPSYEFAIRLINELHERNTSHNIRLNIMGVVNAFNKRMHDTLIVKGNAITDFQKWNVVYYQWATNYFENKINEEAVSYMNNLVQNDTKAFVEVVSFLQTDNINGRKNIDDFSKIIDINNLVKKAHNYLDNFDGEDRNIVKNFIEAAKEYIRNKND